MKTILEALNKNVEKFPDKAIFVDTTGAVTYSEFYKKCKGVTGKILSLGLFNKPIAVVDNRDISTLIAMFAVLYSGNHYVVIDGMSPKDRVKKIYDVLKPEYTLCEEKNLELVGDLGEHDITNTLFENEVSEDELKKVYSKVISTDPAYVLFTSGSTGVPKGTVVSHQNILSYIEWFSEEFEINEKTVFANQAPFYFSVSVSDIYSTVCKGATLCITPKMYFSFPIKLVDFLNENKVNTIYWVPSALCIVANIKLFDYSKPKYLEKVLFAGEIMPNKQLNYWRKNLENCLFANLFGPTETTDICTFYVVNREFKDDESLPIGVSCNNADCFIVGSDGKQITRVNEIGELFVRSPFVAFGYFDNDEKTKSVFVQNPLQNHYPEIVYRTGDLVKLNSYGEFEYVGRKDFQIKHMGYRIELGEIEVTVLGIQGVDGVVSVYDEKDDKIVLIYTGKMKKDELFEVLKKKLTSYMCPNVLIKVPLLELNQNGKIDRNYYKNNYKSLI